MTPTPRLLFLALFGLVPVALSSSTTLSIYIAILWGACIVGLTLLDRFLAPSASAVSPARVHEDKLYLGVWNAVHLTLINHSRTLLQFRIRDLTPPNLVPEGNLSSGDCWPGLAWSLDYRVLPLHRGAYQLGPVFARFRGPLGLVYRNRRWDLRTQAKVYPNLLPVRSYESLARRGQLQEIGLRNARRFGTGTEFEQLRDYTPDDEFRRINWPATARLHRPVSVDYRTERSQSVYLVLDAGRMMSTPIPLEASIWSGRQGSPAALSRFDHAVNAALLLAFVAQQTGDRVGLMCFGREIRRYLPPRPGRRGFFGLLEALHDLEPDVAEPDYELALRYLAARSGQRSLVVLFTDVAEADSASLLVRAMQFLARRHLCLVVTLRDPDLEVMSRRRPDCSRTLYERAVAQALLDDRERLLHGLRDRGLLTVDARADGVSAGVVNRYLEIKARRRL